MAVGVGEVVDAFDLLYRSLLDRQFAKSAGFEHYSERELLQIVRAFLLGYFGKLEPEVAASLPGCSTGAGRIDFVVGDVAVELAVRTKSTRSKYGLCPKNNVTEVKKLLRHKGLGLLVLFDFSPSHLTDDDLEGYRELPSLGRGRWQTSAFNVAYFYRSGRPAEPACIRKNIRVNASQPRLLAA